MVFTCFILVMLSAFEEQAIPPVDVVVEALPNSGEQVSILIGFVVPGVGTSATGYLIATRAN